jgi:hypothetical protein
MYISLFLKKGTKMKYLSVFLCLFFVLSACATGKKITITNITPLSPINKYIQNAVTGKNKPVTIETNDNKMEIYSTWKDGLNSITIVDFMGEKTVHTFNNGVELIMRPNLTKGLTECIFNNGESFTIRED